MRIRRLAGGTLIGTDPNRLPLPLYAKEPTVRVGSPGTLQGTVGTYVLLSECARRQTGLPEPTLVKVLFRETGGAVYLLLAPATAPGPDIYPLKFATGTRAPVVRKLKPLFEAAKIALRPDLWYAGPAELVQDETLGYVVAIDWSAIETSPRQTLTAESAAGNQPVPGAD